MALPDLNKYSLGKESKTTGLPSLEKYQLGAGKAQGSFDFSALNQDLVKTVGDDFKKGWTYDLFDAEDMQRKAKGIMPKATEAKYDLSDPTDRYLYENGLPSLKDNFSKKYSAAQEKAEKEETENAAYQKQYSAFQNELYQKMYDAQMAEYSAASAEGRNPQQLSDWEEIIAAVMGQQKYADVAKNFYQHEELPEITGYDSLTEAAAIRERQKKQKENPNAFTDKQLAEQFQKILSGMQTMADGEANSRAAITPESVAAMLREAEEKRISELDIQQTEAAKAKAEGAITSLAKQREAAYQEYNARIARGDMAGAQAAYDKALGYEDQIAKLQQQTAQAASDLFRAEAKQELEKYLPILEAADFQKYAQQGAQSDMQKRIFTHDYLRHRYINDVGNTRLEMFATDGSDPYGKYQHMTEEETGIYNYLFAKQGQGAANEYLKALDSTLNERQAMESSERIAEMAKEHPYLMSAASVPMSYAKGAGYLYALGQEMAGNKVDPNSPWFNASATQSAIRGAVSEDMSGTGRFLYNTGMSIADFLATSPMGKASLALMGTGTAADTTRDALERGATQEQALALGTLAGAAEIIFEKFSLDNFIKMTAPGAKGAFIKNILKQSGIEASEEFATEIANQISDVLVMGDLSNFRQGVQAYMSQGMTQSQAEARAFKDALLQVGLSGLGGFLSGGVTSSVGQGIGVARTTALGASMREEGDTRSSYQIGNEYIAQLTAQREEARANFAADLQTLGLDQSVSDRVIKAYDSLSEGQTGKAQRSINKLQGAVTHALEVRAETEADLNVARTQAQARLSPLYTAMEQAVQTGNVSAFQEAQAKYMAEFSVQQAKAEAAKVKAANQMETANRAIQDTAAEIEEDVAAQQMEQAEAQAQAEMESMANAPAQPTNPGVVRNFTAQRLSHEQRSQIRVLDALGKKYGVSIVMEDSIAGRDRNGNIVQSGSNAYFDPGTGEIHIALDGTAEGYLYFGVHELVHYLQSFNDGGYAMLQDTVFEALERDNPGMVDALIRQQMEMFGYDEQTARDEVLANTVPVILQDETFVRELVRQDRTLAERIVDFLNDFMSTLGRIYDELIGENSWTQMELLRGSMDTVREIADMFDAALMDAGESRGAGTETVSGIKFSAKEAGMTEEQRAAYDDYVQKALSGDESIRDSFSVGKTSRRLIEDAKEQGADVSRHVHRVRANDIRHVRNSHGILKDGPYGITIGDLQAIPYILENYTEIRVRFDGDEIYGIVYALDHVDTTYYVEGTVSEGATILECKQMVKAPLGDVPQMFHKDFGKKRSIPEYLDKASNDNVPNDVPETYAQDVHQSTASSEVSVPENDEFGNRVFSMKDTSPADIDQLRAENENLRKANEILMEQFKLTRGRKVSRKALDKLSGRILKGYQSQYDRNTLTDNLETLFDEIHKAGDGQWEAIEEASVGLAKAVIEKSSELDDSLYQEYEPMRRYLRETDIVLSDRQKQDVAYQYGSYETFRKKNFGRINLRNEGISLDALWPELAERFPEFFEVDLAEGEQPLALVRALESIKPVYRNPFGFNLDAAAYDLATQIYQEYLNIPEIKTEAGENADRLWRAQKEADERIRQARQESQRQYEERVKEIEARYAARRKELTERYKQATAEQKKKLNERYKAFVDRKNAKVAERLAANKVPKRMIIAREMFQAGVDPVAAELSGEINHLTSKTLQNLYLANGVGMGGKLPVNELDGILEGLDDAKDKSAIGYGRETFLRNLEDIAKTPEQGRRLVETYATPIRHSVADMTRWQRKWSERIAKLNLNHEESAMVQLLGEGQVGPEVLEQGLRYEDGRPMDEKKIQDAVKVFRQFYDEALKMANVALVRNGYEPIPGRERYFPHFMESGNSFEEFVNKVVKGKDQQLPTEISGRTDIFRPGKSWFKNFQQRVGDSTDYDAVKGFTNYLDGVGRAIFLTDSIQRVRQLESAVRGRYSVPDADSELKGRERSEHLNRFAAYLLEYGNQLAGKKAKLDRAIEEALGRKAFAWMDWLKKRFGANAVGGNLSTALSNFIPITQGLATMPKRDFLRGMQAAVSRQVRMDGLWERSDFLMSRFGKPDNLVTKRWDKVAQKGGQVLNFLFETVDRFTAETLVFGKYQEGLRNGLSEEAAMRAADEYAVKTMADRSIGAVPTLMNTKTLGLFTQFQLEVNNQMSNIMKDIPRSAGGDKRKIAAALIQLFLYSWLYNELNEKYITGRRPAFDPIHVATEAVEDFSTGKAGDATVNLVRNVVDQLPFGQLLTGGGRIPLANALEGASPFDAIVKSMNGEDASEAWKNAGEGLLYNFLMPAAGGQVKKVVKGIEAVQDGGRYYGEKLAYPIEKTPGNLVSAVLFGPSAVKEGREFYSENGEALSKSKTETYHALTEEGFSQQEAYSIAGGIPSQSKGAKLGYIATFDADGDGSPDLDKNEMNIVAAVLGIKDDKGNAVTNVPDYARKQINARIKTIEGDGDLTKEEQEQKIEDENLRFFLTVLGK